MEKSERDLYYELAYYTLGHSDKVNFIHQHVVDAFTAQNANENTKPIKITFALVGLYLYVEKNYTGKQVQSAHLQMSNNKTDWPEIELPERRGKIVILNVLAEPPGIERDQMIREWCISVWQAYKASHESIASFVMKHIV